MAADLITVGHGTATRENLADLLTRAGLSRLVDVRRYPGSRAHPHVGRAAMAQWLPETGIAYRNAALPRRRGLRRVVTATRGVAMAYSQAGR
jgi:uncharacterized protein (DUF488 family)